MKNNIIHISKVLRLIWLSSKKWTIVQLVLLILQAGLPIAALYVLKLIVDTISHQVNEQLFEANQFISYVILLGGIYFAITIVNILNQFAKENHQQLVADFMAGIIQAQSVNLELAYYERADFKDNFQRAQQEALYRPSQILDSIIAIAYSGLSILGLGGLLTFLHPGIAVILIIAALPAIWVKVAYAQKLYKWNRNRTQLERKAGYYNFMLTQATPAKETRLYNTGLPFIKVFQKIRKQLYREKFKILKFRSLASLVANVGEILSIVGAFIFIGFQTLKGIITLGSLVMYFQAFQRGQQVIKSALQAIAQLYQNRLFLNYIFEFLDLERNLNEPEHPATIPSKITAGLVIENINFSYPSNNIPVLRNINLTLKKGNVIALVGENGSGKTTLVKLISRLYDPINGTIKLDGTDIRQFKIKEYQHKISVIFQDFMKYCLTVNQNISISNLAQPLNQAQAEEASKKSGAAGIISKLPKTYNNMLGVEFEDGIELSGGQWQKIALARVFYKEEAEILILDEPTGAIDPLAEHQIFAELKQMAKNKIVIIVTHRLYNLKIADKIVVFDQGEIVESGNHEELIKLGGLYEAMFSKQH